jgi:hypothetical protein
MPFKIVIGISTSNNGRPAWYRSTPPLKKSKKLCVYVCAWCMHTWELLRWERLAGCKIEKKIHGDSGKKDGGINGIGMLEDPSPSGN